MVEKKRNKNTKNGFVPIRRGIYEHLKEGRITGQEFMVYLLLHLKADHRTGICYKISGPVIAGLLQISHRQANRLLTRLEKKGYIKRLNHRGQVPYYPVVINRFLTSNGLLIDAPNTKSLNEIACRKDEGCPLTVFQLSYIQEYIQEKSRGAKRPAPTFIPPTPKAVAEYARSINYPFDNYPDGESFGRHFCERYAASDWKHAGGKKVLNWKQTVVSWKRNEQQKEKEQRPNFEPQMPTEAQLAVIEGTGQ